MLLKHLINPKPSIILFFIVFCIFFTILPLVNYNLEALFFDENINSYLLLLLAIIIPFFHSIGLNNLVYEKNIIRKDNFIIGFVYILISSCFFNNLHLWISSFFLLFLLNFLLDSYQKDSPFSQFFNAALLVSILTIPYPNTIYFILLFIISGINFNNTNWRVFASVLLGLLIPYLFYFVFSQITDSHFILPIFNQFSIRNLFELQITLTPFFIWVTVVFFVSFFAFIELFLWLYKKSIRSRKSFLTIFWYFIITVIIAVCSNNDYFYFLFSPLAIIIGNYFVYTKNRKIANILFFLLIISSIFYKYLIGYNL